MSEQTVVAEDEAKEASSKPEKLVVSRTIAAALEVLPYEYAAKIHEWIAEGKLNPQDELVVIQTEDDLYAYATHCDECWANAERLGWT